jgi:hypothetical protein
MYLHAKFRIFLRSLSISTILFPPADVSQIGKEFKMEKIIVGRFLHGWPARYRTTITDKQGPPVGAIFPQSPLLRARVSSLANFPSSTRPPVERSHHLNVHLSTSHCEPSHRLLVL